eukprot:7376188-Prymnesium_polylepis.1
MMHADEWRRPRTCVALHVSRRLYWLLHVRAERPRPFCLRVRLTPNLFVSAGFAHSHISDTDRGHRFRCTLSPGCQNCHGVRGAVRRCQVLSGPLSYDSSSCCQAARCCRAAVRAVRLVPSGRLMSDCQVAVRLAAVR